MVSAARADMLGMSVPEPGGQTVGRARVNATGSEWIRNQRRTRAWAALQRNVVFRYQRLFQEIQPLCDELNEMVMTPRGFDPGRRLAQLS